MQINPNTLVVFHEVAHFQSMTKAASKLFISQPAVSQHIRNLESQLDVALFIREKGRLHLTSFGKRLFQQTQIMIKNLSDIEDVAHSLKSIESGRIQIGASYAAGNFCLPHFIKDFLTDHPGIFIEYSVKNVQKIIEDLEKNKVKLAIISGEIIHPEMACIPLMSNPIVAICSIHHEWRHRKTISAEELEKWPFILREEGSEIRNIIKKIEEEKRIQLTSAMECHSIESVKKFVELNLGVSIMSRVAISQELQSKQLHFVKIKNCPAEEKYSLVYKHSSAEEPLFLALSNGIKKFFYEMSCSLAKELS